VDLVENPEVRFREVPREDPCAIRIDVPVEVARAATQRLRERRLADLRKLGEDLLLVR